MTRELGKSIVLVILVGLSLTLTWSLWSYQGDYAPMNSSEPAKITDIASSYNPDEVIKPFQVVRFNIENSQIMGKLGNGGDALYKLLVSAPLTVHTQLPDKFPKPEGFFYELDFPTSVTTEIIKTLFNFNQQNLSSISQDWLIDHVEVFQTDQKSGNAYVIFKDQEGNPKFFAKGDIDGLISYNNDAKKSGDWLDYTKLNLTNRTIYIPDQPVNSFSTESRLYSLVGFELFKPILFSDPRQVVYSGNIYSDGVSQLVNRQKLVMQYYNTVPSNSGGSSTSFDPISQSYQFINSHKGWTNTFNIDDFTSYPAKSQSKVTFRISENGLPVFSSDDYPYDIESEISLQWTSGELSQLYRTLLEIGVSYKKPQKVTLTSPLESINMLERTGTFKLNTISNFRLGYEMTVDQNDQSVTLTPTWYFEQAGTWYSVTDYLNNHSTNLQNSNLQGSRGGGI